MMTGMKLPGSSSRMPISLEFPLRVTLGEKNLKKGLIEIRKRRTGETILVKREEAVTRIQELVALELEESSG